MKNKITNNINIYDEIKSSYIDYAMSVIISRALPDVRDGLKPVHRRILYSMYKLGVNKGYKKSARIVGEVLGKYHPHGDKSVYDSIVRMSQYWNIRYKLINGQGNFGSIDNDPPAAMRYTEIKLAKITEDYLIDIDKNTVNMINNFDNTLKEPIILPTKIPNLLINGVYGIAVGMATNMPPHNISNTIDCICAYIENNNININKLINIIKGPDFPTGGIITTYKGVINYLKYGKGKIIIRSKYYIKKKNNKKYIIIKEIPYQVIKSNLIKKIYELIKNEKIKEIKNIKDESNNNNIRIIIILKKKSIPKIVINKLLKYSDLQISYYINNIVLVDRKPKRLNLKKLIYYFIKHRNEIIIRKAKYYLLYYKKRIHLLKGFIKISKKIDKLFTMINKSLSYLESFKKLQKNFKLSNEQIKFILNIKLYKFTNKEKKKIIKEYKELKEKIIINKEIIKNKDNRMIIIKNELYDMKNKYGDKRKTLINYKNNNNKYENLNLINYKYLLTISYNGYIKKTLLKEYKLQKRGGKGNIGMLFNNSNDYIEHIIFVNNKDYIYLFTIKGKFYYLKVLDIPEGNKKYKGRAIQNFININKNDKIRSYIKVNKEFINKNIDNLYIVIITNKGIIKRTKLKEYYNFKKNGIYAIKIKNNDYLLDSKLTYGNSDILIYTENGKIIRFNETKIKLTNRKSIGIIGINNRNTKILGMVIINKKYNKYILIVSENGYGKRTNINNYRITNRGRIGINTLKITNKTGKLVMVKNINKNNNDIIIVNNKGKIIRIPIKSVKKLGRNSQGVKLLKLNKNNNDKIVDIEII
ncbi:MAG: DNA gyrase subunit A [Flavobacteriales endosymbiont of Rhyzopertha dominica]|nr:MAG: DNA gyrase subunit A [Candidatus Shikimatogenerans bostrichidophilus]